MGTVRAETTETNVFRFDQSGALLRKVMESAAVGMAVVGADGRTIYVNKAYEAMLGFAPGERLGQTSDEAIYAEDRTTVGLRFDQLLRDEVDELTIECRMNHKHGHPVWALITASLLKSEVTGLPLYVIVQIVNIDRQKRAEAALAETESRWNYALESAGQGVWDYNIPRDDMFYSRMWRQMRGIPDGEYVDPAMDKWLERVHPEDVAKLNATVKKQSAGEDGYDTLEYRERHRDGHYIWILSRGKPVEWNADGKPIRAVGTDTDITRLKLAEAELAEEKERFRVTLESIGEGVIAADADGCVRYMNPVAEHLSGWNEAEALGQPLWQVFVSKNESTGEIASDVIGHCIASGATTEIDRDVILVARDGTGRGVSGTASPVRSEDGRTMGAVLVFKDATDHQEEQRRLAHSASHDGLTGLPNRAAFARALSEACRQVGDERREHALCFIDLDRFKPVNDTAGHAAGDALLQIIARTIRGCCRAQDFAARMGGDEFVVLLADCSQADARAVGQKIVDEVARVDFAWNGVAHHIGASVGIAAVMADAERDVLAMADAACYAAKSAGRGRVVVSGD
jgi:diguanylate cyclase (GGDEF)-like protein/PAS domain S-box-containing protein